VKIWRNLWNKCKLYLPMVIGMSIAGVDFTYIVLAILVAHTLIGISDRAPTQQTFAAKNPHPVSGLVLLRIF
jgi:hypothetical protein